LLCFALFGFVLFSVSHRAGFLLLN